jgi:serine/threonine-protein kinase
LISREKRVDAPGASSRSGIDCCAGLDCALQRGVIHRDIKPRTLLIAQSGVTKIIGPRSRAPLRAAQLPREARRSHLPPDAVVGTFAYMSPEQAEQPAQVDFRTDVYSLGTTLYHAACGAGPFSAKNVRELRRHHARVAVPPLVQLVPGFPPRSRASSSDDGQGAQPTSELLRRDQRRDERRALPTRGAANPGAFVASFLKSGCLPDRRSSPPPRPPSDPCAGIPPRP